MSYAPQYDAGARVLLRSCSSPALPAEASYWGTDVLQRRRLPRWILSGTARAQRDAADHPCVPVQMAGCSLGRVVASYFPRASLRSAIQTNKLHCTAIERLPHDSVPEEATARLRTRSSLQLLCRALRLAPPCYCRLEMAAEQPHEMLTIDSDLRLRCLDGSDTDDRGEPVGFHSGFALAAAMQQSAAAEHVTVCLPPDERSVTVLRSGN